MDFFNNTIDKGEEYLTFFAMCIDNLSLSEFSSLLSGNIFEHYEYEEDIEYNGYEPRANNDNNYVMESIQMAKEDINMLNMVKNEFNDIEIVEYLHLDEYLKNKLKVDCNDIKYLDKTTIIHNLVSLAKLGNDQKLWLYQNVKKMDISSGYYMFRWLLGQSRLKIIPCVVLTVQSALQDKMILDNEIKKHLYESIDGLDKLIDMYPENEDLINLRILIKSKLVY